jgi:uncharacterized RDD family membrane protein YckC
MIIIPGKRKNLSRRYYANVLDYAFLFILIGIYIFAAGDKDESGTYRVVGFKALVMPFIWFLYFPVCESIFGQTIGKKAFNLYVIDSRGETPTIIETTIRRILDPVEMIFFGIAALLMINNSKKNQRAGDMMAGTIVITREAVCRFCGAELELSSKEVIKDVFICPTCSQVN